MAISNLNLNVTANTARALADFNKFSRSLDNKFLISGLKLDVVRGALSQINRDFQRAIGEQGLASASSLRAAQNQAALLTQTFKGFASESALAITTNIGTALNRVAVTAGGTMKDVQKTLLATPFISTRLSEDVRLGLSKGVMEFQTNIRRAGLGDNFGGVAQQFLMGTKTTMQMVQSGNPLEMFLGSELIKRGAGVGEIADPKVRSELMKDLVEDSALSEQLKIAAKRAAGFRIVLEDMNSKLFNPESGVFGSLKKVVDAAGNPTTMFDEVEKLVEQVFGDNGMFAALVKSLRSVFGSGDPMRPFIDGVQFMTRIFKSITEYFNTPGFKAVLGYVKGIVERVTSVFTGIYQQIRGSSFSASEITRTIGEIGESIRGYIKQFGEAIRSKNVSGESGFAGDILGTLVEEVGRTAVVLIKELLMTLINKVPEIATAVLPAINKGINGILTEAFGQTGAALVKFIAGFVPGPIGMIARASAVGDVTGGGGSVGSMLAMGAAAALTPGFVRAAGGFANRRMAATRQQVGGFALPLRYGYGVATRSSFPLNPRRGRTQYRSPAGPQEFNIAEAIGQSTRDYNERQSLMAGLSQGRNLPNNSGINRPNAPRFSGVQQYTSPIGPLPQGSAEPWTVAGQGRGYMGSGYSPYMQSSRFRGNYGFPTEGPRQIPMRGSFPSAYARMRGSYIRDNNDVDFPGVFDNRLSRTPSQGTIDRYNRMYGVRGRMSRVGRGVHRVGMGGGYMLAGSMAASMAGQAVGGAGGEILSGLGQGAMMGATIGSIIPGVGTAAGAVIGGIIGGIAPLMDKGVREAIGKLVTNMGISLNNTMEWFTKGTQENLSKAKDFMGSAVKFFVNGLVSVLNGILTVTQVIPRLMMGMLKELISKVPGADKIPGLSGLIGAGDSLANFSIPTMYGGMGYAGPAMALEARMSGRRPMVVNDGEFVIPRDGFPTLAGIVGDNLRSTGVVNQGTSQPVQVNVTLAITTNAVVADPNELANALREPVYKIIGEAWNEAYNSTRIHRPRVS